MRDRNPGLASVTPEPAWFKQDVTHLPRAVPGESSLLSQNWRITTLTFAEDGQQISISLRIKGARSTCAAGGSLIACKFMQMNGAEINPQFTLFWRLVSP